MSKTVFTLFSSCKTLIISYPRQERNTVSVKFNFLWCFIYSNIWQQIKLFKTVNRCCILVIQVVITDYHVHIKVFENIFEKMKNYIACLNVDRLSSVKHITQYKNRINTSKFKFFNKLLFKETQLRLLKCRIALLNAKVQITN